MLKKFFKLILVTDATTHKYMLYHSKPVGDLVPAVAGPKSSDFALFEAQG
jgi:hypothetical protein